MPELSVVGDRTGSEKLNTRGGRSRNGRARRGRQAKHSSMRRSRSGLGRAHDHTSIITSVCLKGSNSTALGSSDKVPSARSEKKRGEKCGKQFVQCAAQCTFVGHKGGVPRLVAYRRDGTAERASTCEALIERVWISLASSRVKLLFTVPRAKAVVGCHPNRRRGDIMKPKLWPSDSSSSFLKRYRTPIDTSGTGS